MGTENDQITKDDLPDEVVDYIDTIETALEQTTEALEKAQADIAELQKAAQEPVEKNEEDPVKAALAKADPALRSLIEKQQADIAEAQAIAKAEREARLSRDMLAKAEQFPMITEDRDALAKLFRTLADKLTAEESAEVEKLLKAANEQIAKGNLFTEIGKSGAETTISKSVESLAQELLKSHPDWTREQAITQVYVDNPSLYTEALKEGAN